MVKKIAIVLLITTILSLGGISLFVYTNQDVITHEIKERLSESGLHVDFTSMDVNFLTSFPTVETCLRQVQVSNGDDIPILRADQLSIRLHTGRLLSGHVDIDEIRVRDGAIQLVKSKSGVSNFTLKTKEKSETSTRPSLHLKRIALINTDLTFHDKGKNHLIRYEKADLTLVPMLEETDYHIEVDLAAYCPILTIDNTPYVKKQDFELHTKVVIRDDTWDFSSTKMIVGATQIELNGKIDGIRDVHPKVAFAITSATGVIQDLQQMLPSEWIQSLDRHQARGSYRLTGHIEGAIVPGRPPSIRLDADVHDTRFVHDALQHEVDKGKGHFALLYGGGHSGLVTIDHFVGNYRGEKIKGSFQLSSFKRPKTQVCLNGTLALQDVNPNLIPDVLIHDRGYVRLDSFKIVHSAEALAYSGQLDLSSVEGMMKGIGFEIEEGSVEVNDSEINILPTKLASLGLEHLISGQLNVETEVYELLIESKKIDLLRFFSEFGSNDLPAAKPVLAEKITRPQVNIKLATDRMVYDNIQFDHVQAELNYEKNEITTRATMEYCEGVVMAIGHYHLLNGKSKYSVEANHVDLSAVFKQWNDFGQTQVQSKHIEGKGNIQCQVSFDYLSNQKFNTQTLDVVGGVEIPSGELIDLPLLKKFSSYIRIEDLERIKFNQLTNVFQIKKGKFCLPEMFIQSSVANIILAGDQTLDNEIHYAIKVNAGQILTEKIKKHDSKLKPVAARQDGFFNMHYILKGPITDFEYYSNKKEVLRKLEHSLFERDKIIEALKVHFDITDRYKSPVLFQEIPELELEAEGEPSFIPGFE